MNKHKGEIERMQRLKRPIVWLMLTAMLITLLPNGFASKASAATSTTPSAATYFIPDIVELRNTALLSTEHGSSQINRENVYKTNNPTLTATGTFSHVSKDTLKVKIEQLNSVPVTGGGIRWETDSNHFTTGPIVADTNATNKFTASDMTLFSGFNKVTFFGMQGGVERSDSFYVLYDRVPFIENLQLMGAGPTPINLNEGIQVVVPNQTVTIQGLAKNSTKVTVKVNGGPALFASLLEDGTFFTPSLSFQPGLNTIDLTIQNASDSISISRGVYYFDSNEPFTSIDIKHGGSDFPALRTTPTLTDTANTAELEVQVLVPYDSNSFAGNAQYSLGGQPNVTVPAGDVQDEKIVPGPNGVTPAYRLVTFKSQAFAVTATGSQSVNITLTYGTFSTAYNVQYKYLPNETVIKGVDLLPEYNGTQDISGVTRIPLNGSQVDSSDFYIVVRTEKPSDPQLVLVAKYLPLSANSLNLTLVDPQPAGLGSNELVYKINGFSNGQQKVGFQYTGSTSIFTADISYVSKNYIYVANLYDGQTYSFDSKTSHTMNVTGEYIGFENISDPHFNAQVFVNGINADPNPSNPGKWLDITTNPKKATFNLNIIIDAAGPLVYGENRIVFTGTATDGVGNTREIRKELKIYIIDENISKISKFMPTLAVTNREPFDNGNPGSYSIDKMNRIFSITPDFILNNDKYETSQQKYDLVLRGSGASKLNLRFGSQLFFTKDIKERDSFEHIQSHVFTFEGKDYYYSFAGDEKDFILRINDIPFEVTGSHVYNLELVNGTGARTTQRLELNREVTPYRILSPQPTVGDQIVVNKNFVRFDIEAEGATQVIIGKEQAVKRQDLQNRFVLDYVGLKENKSNKIDIEVVREGSKIKDSIYVYYSSSVTIDSQYMTTKPSNKYSVFGKKVELSFPKGTILQSASRNGSGLTKFYPDTKLLFGIADPSDGVVERRNDYGNIINVTTDDRTPGGLNTITIPDYLVTRFNSTVDTSNFSRVSDIYWISGGIGEQNDRGQTGYKPATNGIAPYSIEGNFTEFTADRKISPSNRGELTLSFDANIVDGIGSNISVFRYTDKGYWENVGGEVDSKNHKVTVSFDQFGYYKVMKLRQGYSDITNHPWARNILNALYSKGIMKNLRFNEFGTDDQTTRGEFASLLVKGLNIPLNYDDKQTFFDIVPGARSTTWDYEHIETAARAGIVQGLSEGFFGAEQRITREQAAVMIARAMSLKLAKNDDKLQATLAKSFADSSKVNYYSRPAIVAVSKAKIMEGSPVTIAGQKKPVYHFNPKGNMTRAEAGKIAVELLKKSTNLFPQNLS
ncbi:S-layer homology domain-containing protein [Paenibacillus sp. GCM10028914]|uniref:S-layer homology domain-containing protein n=1 Tax=Paenibacillus sp. GCM10028914 TaxID=3273416 RepID=UPI00360BF0E0